MSQCFVLEQTAAKTIVKFASMPNGACARASCVYDQLCKSHDCPRECVVAAGLLVRVPCFTSVGVNA
jgi:hypothetical protein